VTDDLEKVVVQPGFGSATVSLTPWHHRFMVQTQIGLVLTLGVLAAFLGVVGSACALVFQGKSGDVGPLLQATQPFILPTLGAAVGYAFGQQASPGPGSIQQA
jgi:hypothetical protein